MVVVGEEWQGQLKGMEEKANAAIWHCPDVPVVQANATALMNLLKGEPASSVLLRHPSKGWNFVPAAAGMVGGSSSGGGQAGGAVVQQSPPRSPAEGGRAAKVVTVGVSSRSSDWRRRPV